MNIDMTMKEPNPRIVRNETEYNVSFGGNDDGIPFHGDRLKVRFAPVPESSNIAVHYLETMTVLLLLFSQYHSCWF